jgi:hypothetical protein
MNDEIREVPMVVENGMVELLNKSEIDQQVATAKKYPRSITKFRLNALSLVTMSEKIADSCIYALPRGGKTIEGPTSRFAEVIANTWGNCRAASRVVDDRGEFVTAQGAFYDLEQNVCITYEVQRRITDKKGVRFNADMIGVTANAACSIALRNAILKGVPKAFWEDMYDKAREVVKGDFATLGNRRADIFARCLGFGVSREQVLGVLGVAGEADVTLEHIVTLRGILNAIKEGDTTPEQAFSYKAETELKKPQSKTKPEEKPEEKPKSKTVKTEDEGGQKKEKQPPEESAKSGSEEMVPVLTKSMRDVLAAKMEGAGLSTVDLERRFDESIDGITQDQWPTVLAWVANPMEG